MMKDSRTLGEYFLWSPVQRSFYILLKLLQSHEKLKVYQKWFTRIFHGTKSNYNSKYKVYLFAQVTISAALLPFFSPLFTEVNYLLTQNYKYQITTYTTYQSILFIRNLSTHIAFFGLKIFLAVLIFGKNKKFKAKMGQIILKSVKNA